MSDEVGAHESSPEGTAPELSSTRQQLRIQARMQTRPVAHGVERRVLEHVVEDRLQHAALSTAAAPTGWQRAALAGGLRQITGGAEPLGRCAPTRRGEPR